MRRRLATEEMLDIVMCLTEAAEDDADAARFVDGADLSAYLAERSQRLSALAATVERAVCVEIVDPEAVA